MFDNGLARGWSRVVEIGPNGEVTPLAEEIRGERFFTRSRGSVERLPNQNLLISVSAEGRVVEVDPEGRVVWEWWSPVDRDEGRRSTLVRARLARSAE